MKLKIKKRGPIRRNGRRPTPGSPTQVSQSSKSSYSRKLRHKWREVRRKRTQDFLPSSKVWNLWLTLRIQKSYKSLRRMPGSSAKTAGCYLRGSSLGRETLRLRKAKMVRKKSFLSQEP